MGRRQGCIAGYTLAVVQHQMPKSSPLGSQHFFCGDPPAPPVKPEWLWVGKAFPSAEQKGHCAGDPLLLGTKVPNVLMCCLSSGLKMFFVICLDLFMSLC